ncbi:hypothetical protein AGRHK599_LOCUS4987 [Rhizobium rhizogenes]|uniref:Uncharacterized protein n=2 Tax=Rhizobium/Agrobacterium group TaxID=227290 RepID=A0AAN2DG38_RHIRH|nr:hypothetical protein AGRHK599_LOCUS4987 [Rhizobium rhizogenes]
MRYKDHFFNSCSWTLPTDVNFFIHYSNMKLSLRKQKTMMRTDGGHSPKEFKAATLESVLVYECAAPDADSDQMFQSYPHPIANVER